MAISRPSILTDSGGTEAAAMAAAAAFMASLRAIVACTESRIVFSMSARASGVMTPLASISLRVCSRMAPTSTTIGGRRGSGGCGGPGGRGGGTFAAAPLMSAGSGGLIGSNSTRSTSAAASPSIGPSFARTSSGFGFGPGSSAEASNNPSIRRPTSSVTIAIRRPISVALCVASRSTARSKALTDVV